MKLVDLFAGAGGLSCGLKMAGFQPVFANELVSQYAETYKKNHPDAKVFVGDIRQVKKSELRNVINLEGGEIDLLAGGPPCQGFSVNSPIRSLDDERNHLFREFLQVASVLRPKAILMENVTGIIQLGKGSVVKQVYRSLQDLGYRVEHRILFAGHYGVPQTRFRTIFLATRQSEAKIGFPLPTHNAKATANFTGAKELCLDTLPLFSSHLKKHTTVWDAISDMPSIKCGSRNDILLYTKEAQSEYQSILRRGSKAIWNHSCASLGKANLARLKYIPQGGSWRDIPHDLLPEGMKRAKRTDHTKRYGRLHPDRMCSTILTKCDPHWGSFFHPNQDRVLSVREAARIQSFPDHYQFTGSLTQQYAQVGNAVPPLMAKAIGESIRSMISDS